MKVSKIEIVDSQEAVFVRDSFIGSGYLQGAGGSLPDVDIDYQSDRRQEVKEYIERRYNHSGKQRVFSAGTYTTLKLKAVLKDVARTYRVPVNIVNYITAIFQDDGMDWTGLFKLAATNKKVKSFINTYPHVIEDIRSIMNQPRSASVHASALIVTPDTKDGEDMECFDFTPIKKMDGVLVSELDGYSIDAAGLLKNDCLGIKELAKLKDIINQCNEQYGAGLTLESIVKGDLNDEKAYRLLSEGYTQNIFQMGSTGMTRFLMEMRPTNINDLIAANALFRPATLESGSTEQYVDRKNGDVEPTYLWGTYNSLKDTFGLLTFQEQLAQMAREIGNFSIAEGVNLVKLISKKRVDKIHAMKEKFMSGAEKNGCPKDDAEAIWNMIESGGSYLFNKSHATAYGVTAYAGAYLKANYPTAFYTTALQWADDKETSVLMSEMEQCSRAKIVPPDINVSGSTFFTNYQTDEIFWSLAKIRMVGVKTTNYIVEERDKNGPFTSVANFVHRVFKYKLQKYQYFDDPDDPEEFERVPVNARHVRHLVLAGCFDKIENVKAVSERYRVLKEAARELGFELREEEYPANLVDKHYFWSSMQVRISGVGAIDYRRIYDNSDAKKEIKGKASYMTLAKAADLDNEGKRIAVCATVLDMEVKSYKDKQTGEKKEFCKIKLQQNTDLIEMIMWNDFYQSRKHILQDIKDKIIIVTAAIGYSQYSSCNELKTLNSSLLFVI